MGLPATSIKDYLHQMRVPAVTILSALALILLANAALRHTRFWYCFPVQYEDSTKLYTLATEQEPYDVVVLGSSVSYRGVIAGVMEEELDRTLPRKKPWRVYNVGLHGACLPAFIEVTRNLLGSRQKPKVTIIMLTTVNLSESAEVLYTSIQLFTTTWSDFQTVLIYAPNNRVRWAAIKGLLHGIQVVAQIPFMYHEDKLIKQYVKLHGSAYRYPLIVKGKVQKQRGLPADLSRKLELRDERVATLKSNKLLANFRISRLIDVWMERLTAEAKKKNMLLILTLAPESDWLCKNVYHGERTSAVRYLTEFAARERTPFYDLSQPPFHFDDEDFFDGCNHLGPNGAERLSRQLVKQVVVPALQGPGR